MSTYLLTTPVPSGSPGQAAWTDGAVLPGATVTNGYGFDFIMGLATPIPGSDTTAQGFDYFFTVPAGVLTAGATIKITFVVLAQIANAGVDSYKWGVEIGGVQSLSGVITPVGVQSYVATQAAIDGGFANFLTPPPGLDMAAFTGLVDVDGTVTASQIFAPGVDPSLPVPVKVAWEWQAGTNANSVAYLASFGVTVTQPAP